MRLCTLLILLLTLALMAGPAHALKSSLTGSATLGVQQYRGESGDSTQEASSLYQQYEVMVHQQNLLANGRAGSYSLMAGYEITLLDPSLEQNGVRDSRVGTIDTSKFFYNGNLLLAPGGLPFRLNLFARDTKRSVFSDNGTYAAYNTGLQSDIAGSASGHLIDPDIYTDIGNGTQNTIGATFLLGIRNGSYLGAYRDVLSQLPRLLIDYKQDTIKDMHSSLNKTHQRTRDLAFVSLNKKDNWVHVRMRDHTDFINPENDSETKQVMIGTIDHLLNRQWINLTNWIKISGDLSYTIDDRVEEDPVHTYNINMMGIFRREGLSGSVLHQFIRENNGSTVFLQSEVPMSVTIDANRDTRILSRLVYLGTQKTLLDGQALNSSDPLLRRDVSSSDLQDFYLDTMLELQRSRQVIIKPRIELESRSEEDDDKGLAVRLGGEVLSNSRLNKSFNWLGGYALTVTRSDDSAQRGGGTYVQNEIYGRLDKELSSTLRIGGNSSLTIGDGEGRQAMGFRIQTMSNSMQGVSGGANQSVDSRYSGTLMNGDLNLYLDHLYHRIGNRLELDFEFFSAEEVTNKRSMLQHILRYTVNPHNISWSSNLTMGDGITAPRSIVFDFVGDEKSSADNNTAAWNSRVDYSYTPNRSAGFTLVAAAGGVTGDTTSSSYKFSEELLYRIFTSNGIIRRIAEFSEEIGYEKNTAARDGREDNTFGRFSATYFPTHYLYTKVRSEIVLFLSSDSQQQISAAEVGFDFEKLKIFACYSQGVKDRESELLPEIKEDRWEVKVKKLF